MISWRRLAVRTVLVTALVVLVEFAVFLAFGRFELFTSV